MSCLVLDTDLRHCTALSFSLRMVGWQFASYANKPTDVVWPSNTTVAAALGVTKRHVQRAVTKLEQLGILQTDSRTGGRHRTTRWRFNRTALQALSTPCGKPVENSGAATALLSGKGDIPVARFTQDLKIPPESNMPLASRRLVRKADKSRKKPPTSTFRRLIGVACAVMRQHPSSDWWSEAKARCVEQGLPYWQPSPSGGIALDAAFRVLEYRTRRSRT